MQVRYVEIAKDFAIENAQLRMQLAETQDMLTQAMEELNATANEDGEDGQADDDPGSEVPEVG